MKKVIVTGGCGFIGSAVVNTLLARDCEVHVIDDLSLGKNHWADAAIRPSLHVQSILELHLCERIFKQVEPDAVIHLAAHHYIPFCERNPDAAYRLNVCGTLNVVELCRRFDVKKFFFASTGDVYPPSFSPHREIDMVAPIYTYGHTKYLAEQVCIKYFTSHLQNSAAVIGRIFNAAGPRETNPHLIPEVVRQIIEGKRVIEVGNLWPQRDFVDVDSMAEVIVGLIIRATGTEVVNIGSGLVQEIGRVLDLLKSVAPHAIEVLSVASRQRPNDRPYLCPDTTRLLKLNGLVARPFDVETARRIFAEAAR